MNNEVVIVCPELVPGQGGLADYTLRVVEEWGDRAAVRFIENASGNRAGVLRAQLPASGGKVLLQYSAYGFGRFGYPRWLLRTLTDWKRASGGLLVIMFHEIWTFWPLLNKNYLVQQLHRADIRKLVSVADAVFSSTPSQAEHLLSLVPSSAVQVLPVGSNIRRAATADAEREAGLAVLFGLGRARIRTLREMQQELQPLAAANVLRKIVTAGGGLAGDEERTALSELRLPATFAQRGPLPEAEISKLLSTASFGISSQDKLSLHKSGTFMAYAAHGLNILSPFGDSLGAEPLCWLTSPAELLRGVSPDELRSRGENLRAWQERTSSWPAIAERFANALQLEL